MAYNNLNHYKQIYFIQQYTLKMQKKGIKNVRIHENLSKVYPMTIQTFYSYLAQNVKAKLRAMKVDFNELKKESEYINSIIPE